eukprot:SAG11_NODE_1564_length_4675_cov_2.781687_2_plen_86_part_00
MASNAALVYPQTNTRRHQPGKKQTRAVQCGQRLRQTRPTRTDLVEVLVQILLKGLNVLAPKLRQRRAVLLPSAGQCTTLSRTSMT